MWFVQRCCRSGNDFIGSQKPRALLARRNASNFARDRAEMAWMLSRSGSRLGWCNRVELAAVMRWSSISQAAGAVPERVDLGPHQSSPKASGLVDSGCRTGIAKYQHYVALHSLRSSNLFIFHMCITAGDWTEGLDKEDGRVK